MKAMFLAKNNFTLTRNASGLCAAQSACQSPSTGKEGDISALISILRSFGTVYTSPALYGQCIEAGIKARQLNLLKETEGNPYVQNIDYMVAQCLDNGVGIFITAGGDGTASYVASSVIRQDRRTDIFPMFLGFPAGTANAGPIVHPLRTGDISALTEVALDAIEVKDGDQIIGYGFNDVIIGNSFLATENGRMVNLDAGAMALHGEKVEVRPGGRITGRDFAVTLDCRTAQIPQNVVQICISCVGQMALGPRAVLGGLLNSEGDPHPAAAAFIDRIMIDSDPSSWNWRGPVTTTHICFTEEHMLQISGLGEDACIIIDGNPFVRKTDRLSFRIVPRACTALWDIRGND